jgi:hypothetical protein
MEEPQAESPTCLIAALLLWQGVFQLRSNAVESVVTPLDSSLPTRVDKVAFDVLCECQRLGTTSRAGQSQCCPLRCHSPNLLSPTPRP